MPVSRMETGHRKISQWHFISDDYNLALTFKDGLQGVPSCGNNTLYSSDQGMVVEFLTPIAGKTFEEHAATELHLETPKNDNSELGRVMVFINAMLQVEYALTKKLTRDVFWQGYKFSCEAMALYLELLKTLISANPTQTVRFLLQKSEIYARASMDVIEVYNCIELPEDAYKIMPMKEDCTTLLPIKFSYTNTTYNAYLDHTTNVIQPYAPTTACKMVEDAPVTINGSVLLYQPDTGELRPAGMIDTLQFHGIHLAAKPVDIPEVMFQTPSIMNWDELLEHHSMSDMFTAASQQRRILKKMGVEWKGDTEEAADQSLNQISNRGFMSSSSAEGWGVLSRSGSF